jgi:hypothetical protein
MPSAVDSGYLSHPSEASATTYLPTTDDSCYYYFGDMTGYDVGAIPSPFLASLENMYGNHETKHEMPPESQKEESPGKKKTPRVVRTNFSESLLHL